MCVCERDIVLSSLLVKKPLCVASRYSWDAMQKFFDQNSTKDLLHIPRALHFGTAPEVKENLKADIMSLDRPEIAGTCVFVCFVYSYMQHWFLHI